MLLYHFRIRYPKLLIKTIIVESVIRLQRKNGYLFFFCVYIYKWKSTNNFTPRLAPILHQVKSYKNYISVETNVYFYCSLDCNKGCEVMVFLWLWCVLFCLVFFLFLHFLDFILPFCAICFYWFIWWWLCCHIRYVCKVVRLPVNIVLCYGFRIIEKLF